jgi:acyl-CoA synthetase (AMP-forming)/AMP-acid ligase II
VHDVVVVGLPDEIYGQRVVAAIVPEGPEGIDASELKAFTAAKLSAYKVPSSFVLVDSLPVNTTTGKISRRDVVSMLAGGAEPPKP